MQNNTEGEGMELMDIQDDKGNIEVPFFSFESILVATDNFSEQNKLGQGGFGPVYKVFIQISFCNLFLYARNF